MNKLDNKDRPEAKQSKYKPYLWAIGLWCAGFCTVVGLSLAVRMLIKIIS